MKTVTVDISRDDLLFALAAIFKTYAIKNNPRLQDALVPAAPDSSKFSAIKKGAVEFRRNLMVHDYGSSRTSQMAVTFGTVIPNVDMLVRGLWNTLEQKLECFGEVRLDNSGVLVKCQDNKTVAINYRSGTAYNGIYVF